MMDDDELCLCFHITRRKVIQYIRVQQPRRTSELSQCYGAGTGCGWCRPFLARLLERERNATNIEPIEDRVSSEQYAQQRAEYRRDQRSEGV